MNLHDMYPDPKDAKLADAILRESRRIEPDAEFRQSLGARLRQGAAAPTTPRNTEGDSLRVRLATWRQVMLNPLKPLPLAIIAVLIGLAAASVLLGSWPLSFGGAGPAASGPTATATPTTAPTVAASATPLPPAGATSGATQVPPPPGPTTAATPGGSVPTDVKYVLALSDVNIRSGPGTNFSTIGSVFGGQMALVTGASADGQWWRVICPDDTTGNCWVSADPKLTQPTTPPAMPRWVVYRDARYGYGLAVPCQWQITATPQQGSNPAMTMRSYDDAFFLAHSQKGNWTNNVWPAGAMKMDFIVMEGLATNMSLAEAIKQTLSSDTAKVESVQSQLVGANKVEVVTLSNSLGPSETKVFAFRLAADKALVVTILPNEVWESSDVQAILGSLVMTSAENVALPARVPGAAIIPVPAGCGG